MTFLVKLHFGQNIFAVVVDTNSRLDWLGPFKGALNLKFAENLSRTYRKFMEFLWQCFSSIITKLGFKDGCDRKILHTEFP